MIYVCDSIQNRKSITRSGAIRPRMIAVKAMTMVAMVAQAADAVVTIVSVALQKRSQIQSKSTVVKLETNRKKAAIEEMVQRKRKVTA